MNTPSLQNEILTQFIMHLQKQAYAEPTVRTKYKILRTMMNNNASLDDPEAVKLFIARKQSWSNGHKILAVYTYNEYARALANASRPLALKLSISMETGLRPVELCRLKVKDIDTEHKAINPITAKHGAPRTLKISENLNHRIQEHIIQNKLQPNDHLFKGNSDYYGKLYRAMRNNLAKKLNDPAIHAIRLYDFRHYFCTMTLHKTKDAFFTMNQMGHKKTHNDTEVYASIRPRQRRMDMQRSKHHQRRKSTNRSRIRIRHRNRRNKTIP